MEQEVGVKENIEQKLVITVRKKKVKNVRLDSTYPTYVG
jgi:hypothetical protein